MKIVLKSFTVVVLFTFALHSDLLARETSDKEQQGLVGPVRSVHTESRETSIKFGQQVQKEKKPRSTEALRSAAGSGLAITHTLFSLTPARCLMES